MEQSVRRRSFPVQEDLSSLGSGQRGVITELQFSGGKRRRLMELGFIAGAAVTALQKAPFGGAVSYEVMGTVIALRPAAAQHIGIRRIN